MSNVSHSIIHVLVCLIVQMYVYVPCTFTYREEPLECCLKEKASKVNVNVDELMEVAKANGFVHKKMIVSRNSK